MFLSFSGLLPGGGVVAAIICPGGQGGGAQWAVRYTRASPQTCNILQAGNQFADTSGNFARGKFVANNIPNGPDSKSLSVKDRIDMAVNIFSAKRPLCVRVKVSSFICHPFEN